MVARDLSNTDIIDMSWVRTCSLGMLWICGPSGRSVLWASLRSVPKCTEPVLWSIRTCMSLFLAHSTINLSMWWWVENLVKDSNRFMETDWYTWATCFRSLTKVISLNGSVYCLMDEKSSFSSMKFNLSSTFAQSVSGWKSTSSQL